MNNQAKKLILKILNDPQNRQIDSDLSILKSGRKKFSSLNESIFSFLQRPLLNRHIMRGK